MCGMPFFPIFFFVSGYVYKSKDKFYHPNDEEGTAWNAPEIGIVWSRVSREYKGTASAKGYCLDGMELNLSDKD